MRRTPAFILAPALLVLSACSPTLSSAPATTGPIDQAFAGGGTVHMDLSAGKYVITGTGEDRLRVRWSARDPDDAKTARVVVDVKDATATIVTDGPSNNFLVEIELPSRSDLTVRLSAGDLSVTGIEGNKDLSAWAGEMRVGVRNTAEYGNVSASVTAGEIRAAPFGEKREGVFPSFSWKGEGRYQLSTRLTAGQITFNDERAAGQEGEESAPPAPPEPPVPPQPPAPRDGA